MKRLFSTTLILFAACFNGFSQLSHPLKMELFVKPHVGFQVPYARYDRSIGKASTFKPRYFDITDNWGLMLQLKLNDEWSIASGLSYGNIGWGYRIEVPDHLVKNPYGSPRASHSTSNYIYRFPIQALRTLKDITYFPLNREQRLYLFNFKLHVLGGVSVDYLSPKSKFAPYAGGLMIPSVDGISYSESTAVKNRWGASAILGLGMQFYHNGKEQFELNLYYSQGLRDMLQTDIDYTMNTESRSTRMMTRGSFVGATLAYPILLKTYKESSLPE